MFENINLVGIVGLILTVFAAVWSLAWWLSGQFTAIRNLVYNEIKSLERNVFDKIDYHEKHDDSRFGAIDARLSSIRDDIWDIRVRNSAKDTMMENINTKMSKLNGDSRFDQGVKQGNKESESARSRSSQENRS